ncbi:hypothetical protein GOV14_04170 [Candidatus Pacearchaeota archaeon]|nr:hypothetical protein [Candidatus Pacearchaeota archaeon]
MLRKEIVKSSENVYRLLKTSGIFDIVLNFTRKGGESLKGETLFEVHKIFSLGYSEFNDAEISILNIFDLNYLNDESFWSALIANDPEKIHDAQFKIRNLLAYLPLSIKLLQRDSDKIVEKEELEKRDDTELEPLTAYLIEDTLSSSPERLIMLFESINLFYEVSSEVHKIKDNNLKVIGCDSGSTKVFDFQGVGEVIKEVKEIFFGIWDRVVFYREMKLDVKLDLIAKELPIQEKISKMEKDKDIAPERAEILRKKIRGGTQKVLEAGVLIPEMDEQSSFNPRKLMAPVPKLLRGKIEEQEKGEGNSKGTEENKEIEIRPDEEGILKKFLKELRKESKKESEKEK